MGNIYKESIVTAIEYAIVNSEFNITFHLSNEYRLIISGGDYESTITLTNNSSDLIEVFFISKYANKMDWLFNKGEVINIIADKIYEKCKN